MCFVSRGSFGELIVCRSKKQGSYGLTLLRTVSNRNNDVIMLRSDRSEDLHAIYSALERFAVFALLSVERM